MIVDTEQLVSQCQVLSMVRKRQGMEDLSERLLAYYLKKPAAPKPIPVAGRKLYLRAEIEAWNPTKQDVRGRKKKKRNSPGGGGSE